MTIIIDGNRIKGVYCYASQLKSINLRGRIIDVARFEMDELDVGEKITGHFDGEFPETDPRGKFGASKLECEVMTGWWHSNGGVSAKLPFYLVLESETGGTLEHRYSAAGAENDEPLERLVLENSDKIGEPLDHLLAAAKLGGIVEVRHI